MSSADRIERARQLKAKRDRRNKLFGEAAAWRKASELRDFVSAVLSQHQADSDDQTRGGLAQWANWAMAEADRIDPLRQPVERLLALPAEGKAIA